MGFTDGIMPRGNTVLGAFDSAYCVAIAGTDSVSLWGIYPIATSGAMSTASWVVKDKGGNIIAEQFYSSASGFRAGVESVSFPIPVLVHGLVVSTQGMKLRLLVSDQFSSNV